MTIVGVVHDVKQSDWRAVPREELYLPFLQSAEYLGSPESHFSFLSFVVRAGVDPVSISGAVQNAVQSIDANVLVRMALGANTRMITRLALSQGIRPVLAGIAAGAARVDPVIALRHD